MTHASPAHVGPLLAVALLCVATPAVAETPNEGDTCAITKKTAAGTKAGGKAKAKLAKGKKVVVGAATGDSVLVTLGKQKLYVKAGTLAKVCKIVKRAAPSPATDAVAPEQTAATATTDAAPIGSEDRAAAAAAAQPTTTRAPPTPLPAGAAFGDTGKIKAAVMDLTATATLPADLVAALSGIVAETLEQTGAFRAIASQDIVRLLSYEAQRQQLGCDDISCLAEIGGALGADYLVTGSLTQAGPKLLVQLQLANIQSARVDQRLSRDFTGDPAALVDELRTATRILVRDLLAKRSGALALSVNEEGATIKIDGTVVGVTPLASLTVAGGVHSLTLEKEGFVSYRADLTIEEGRTLAHDALLFPSADFVLKQQRHARFVRSASWVALSAGLVGVAGAGALWYVADQETKRLNRRVTAYNAEPSRSTTTLRKLNEREAKIAMMDVGTVGAGALGVAGLATWIVLRAVGDDPDRYAHARTALQVGDAGAEPAVGVTVVPGGVSVGGRF